MLCVFFPIKSGIKNATKVGGDMIVLQNLSVELKIRG